MHVMNIKNGHSNKQIPKYINMLIFSVGIVAIGYKQTLSFSIFYKKNTVLFSKNNLERNWHSQVIHSNKYKYKFNFILNFTIYLSGRQGRNLFTIFYINLSPFFHDSWQTILINCDSLSECNHESGPCLPLPYV